MENKTTVKTNGIKKIITFVLVLALLSTAVMCACGPEKKKGNNPVGPSVSVEETLDIPVIDWNGQEYRVASMSADENSEFYCDDTNLGDPVRFALYTRNQEIESKYNTKIKLVHVDVVGTDMNYHAHTYAIADDISYVMSKYDVATTHTFASSPLITSYLIKDWMSQKYTNTSKSYWLPEINNDYILDGKLFAATGATNITNITFTYGLMYNRDAGDDKGVTEDLFKTIRDQKFTIDYFNTLVESVYEDLDQTEENKDFFGFATETQTHIDNWNFVFGMPMIETSSTEREFMKLVYDRTKVALAADKLDTLFWENKGTIVNGNFEGAFLDGNVLFYQSCLNNCYDRFRNLPFEYTILPFPKLDETQETYNTGVMDNMIALSIPMDAPNLDFSSHITEAINYGANKHMVPVYVEHCLQSKFFDEENLDLVNMLLDGRKTDPGVMFQSTVAAISCWLRFIVADRHDVAVYFDENVEAAQNGINNLIMVYRSSQGANG